MRVWPCPFANGATDLLVKVFGDLGRPTRSAVGTASLPFNFAVELEAIVELRDSSGGSPRLEAKAMAWSTGQVWQLSRLALMATSPRP